MTESDIPGAVTPEKMLQQQQPQTPLHEAAAEQLPDVQPSELVAALQGGEQIGGGMSSMVATQP